MPFGSEAREPGIGLAMSGGGFRSVLFHVGMLWRLNELGVLPRLNRVSSVSGGSITAGVLAVHWDALDFDEQGRAKEFDKQVTRRLRAFCSRNIDVVSVLTGAINPFKSAGEEVADAYRDHLGMAGKTLQDLSDKGPNFVFNATNYATGVSFRFSKRYAGDWRIGLIKNPRFEVALAVACSSAFPPVLAPVEIDIKEPDDFEQVSGADLWERKDFRRRLWLADGGVYDNLGLETVWDRYETVLVSDAGKPFEMDAGVASFAPKQIMRVMDIGLNQALALRKRKLIDDLRSGAARGAYWGIATDITRHTVEQRLPVAPQKIQALAGIRTRLDRFTEQEQCELINWGYAVCDAALRCHAPHVAPSQESPKLPYPQWPLG